MICNVRQESSDVGNRNSVVFSWAVDLFVVLLDPLLLTPPDLFLVFVDKVTLTVDGHRVVPIP